MGGLGGRGNGGGQKRRDGGTFVGNYLGVGKKGYTGRATGPLDGKGQNCGKAVIIKQAFQKKKLTQRPGRHDPHLQRKNWREKQDVKSG